LIYAGAAGRLREFQFPEESLPTLFQICGRLLRTFGESQGYGTETIPGRVSDEVKNGDARRTDATVKPRRCKLYSGDAFDLKARPKLKDAKPNAAVHFNFLELKNQR